MRGGRGGGQGRRTWEVVGSSTRLALEASPRSKTPRPGRRPKRGREGAHIARVERDETGTYRRGTDGARAAAAGRKGGGGGGGGDEARFENSTPPERVTTSRSEGEAASANAGGIGDAVLKPRRGPRNGGERDGAKNRRQKEGGSRRPGARGGG
ncbi:hypothetical protein BDY21DRAFT_95712 [Lineolata rhizophorae]|uniref:Uncharacterized protein n=1 Tax=Lineolata rhizophorae TaxID=578093 RepID=A0A6A6NSY7_9PEZI|nr:hypothetical protein BDY21DRAFT_95712 [Lineolata rhizophorae]